MKTVLKLFGGLLLCNVLYSCQVASLIKQGTTFYQGAVEMKDGSMVEGRIGGLRSSNFPSTSKKVSLKTESGRKIIPSADVRCLYLWDKDHPELKNQLIYSDFQLTYNWKKKEHVKKYKGWLYAEYIGENLVIASRGTWYSLDRKTGGLVTTYDKAYGIEYYGLRRGDSIPEYICSSNTGKKRMREMWSEYLKDDPDLVNKIVDKAIEPFDFKTITDTYSPKQ